MTLDEAIETLHEDLGADIYDSHPYFYQAQKLGIEALKCVKELRAEACFRCPAPLPGETEEVKHETAKSRRTP